MIFTVLFGYRQIVLVAFGLGVMAKASQHDTTSSPDDQDERKSMENPDTDTFRTSSRYLPAILDTQKTEYNGLPFIYHIDNADGDDDFLSENSGNVRPLVNENDALAHDRIGGGGMVKRLSGNFKQGGRKFKYDPALKLMGLGKRDKDGPKYNPGWKFIGLGKREPLEPEVDPSLFKMADARDYKWKTTDEVNPYLSLLTLDNVREFLETLNGEIGRISRRDYPGLNTAHVHRMDSGRPQAIQDVIPAARFARPNRENNPGSGLSLFTRARKPTGGWKNKARPMYDPGWVMTGLGK